MPLVKPFPELSEFLHLMGEAGVRLSEINASEGAAGNLSVFLGWHVDPQRKFPIVQEIQLPVAVPELAGGVVLMSGSGRRLREIIDDPTRNLGVVAIDPGGETGKLYTSPVKLFEKLSSEFNSHLAIHNDQVAQTGTNFHAVAHAQPRYLTYLSHIPQYRDEAYFNRHLLRWEPELIVNLPEGIGIVPFQVPGSPALQRGTVESLRHHRIIVWCKHGVVARSDVSIKRAVDRIDYLEAAAHFEYLDLANHQMADRLSDEEIRAICEFWNVHQTIF
ncbi:MAG: rhamnulose-1-phosphate aldolase [Chloroflexi bacterium]|nr:rhamnulose-1-phosphate aldolase [Chloroflexota bacterium]